MVGLTARVWGSTCHSGSSQWGRVGVHSSREAQIAFYGGHSGFLTGELLSSLEGEPGEGWRVASLSKAGRGLALRG